MPVASFWDCERETIRCGLPLLQTTVAFALEDLDSDNRTKPELAVLAVNHDETTVGSDYKLHYYTQGPSGAYTEMQGSSNPLLAVELCGAATCDRSPPCCTALTFAGRSVARSGRKRRSVCVVHSVCVFWSGQQGTGRGLAEAGGMAAVVTSCSLLCLSGLARVFLFLARCVLARFVADYDNDGRSV